MKAFEKNEPYIQCLKDNHNNFFSVTEYIGYRSITKHMSDFENYVQNKEYDISFYRRIARKTYESISGKYTQDIPSRLALIETMVEQCAVEDAENLEIAKEKYNSALKYKPDERKASIAIELIEEEQSALERLLQEEPKGHPVIHAPWGRADCVR